eukprot:23305-Rhodomonas_salina.2
MLTLGSVKEQATAQYRLCRPSTGRQATQREHGWRVTWCHRRAQRGEMWSDDDESTSEHRARGRRKRARRRKGSSQLAEAERAEAVGVTDSDEVRVRQDHDRESSLSLRAWQDRSASDTASGKIGSFKRTWVMASKIWSSWLLRFECEIRCRKSSESTVDCVSTPWSWKKERSSEALLRFPLCASARFFPLRYRTQNGWNPSSAVLPPAVEYRVCPIAWIPSSCFTSSGLNTSVTRPCPLCNRNSFACTVPFRKSVSHHHVIQSELSFCKNGSTFSATTVPGGAAWTGRVGRRDCAPHPV